MCDRIALWLGIVVLSVELGRLLCFGCKPPCDPAPHERPEKERRPVGNSADGPLLRPRPLRRKSRDGGRARDLDRVDCCLRVGLVGLRGAVSRASRYLAPPGPRASHALPLE